MTTESTDTRESVEEKNNETPDVFSESFAEASKEVETPDKVIEPEKVETPPATAQPVTPPVAGELTPPEEPPKPSQQPGESDESYKQRWATLQGIWKSDKTKWELEKQTYEEKIAELQGKIPPPAETIEKKPDNEVTDFQKMLESLNLTDEQKAALAEYEEEFDVVSKMEGIKRKKELGELKVEILKSIDGLEKKFQAQLVEKTKPAEEFISETKKSKEEADKEAHFNYIGEYHPDFLKYKDDGSLMQWIESKPAYLKIGMKAVCEHGTADEVVELYDAFKKENNIPITKEPSNVVSMNQHKQERMKALTPPITRRGAVNTSMPAANDFDSAFDEANRKLSQ